MILVPICNCNTCYKKSLLRLASIANWSAIHTYLCTYVCVYNFFVCVCLCAFAAFNALHCDTARARSCNFFHVFHVVLQRFTPYRHLTALAIAYFQLFRCACLPLNPNFHQHFWGFDVARPMRALVGSILVYLYIRLHTHIRTHTIVCWRCIASLAVPSFRRIPCRLSSMVILLPIGRIVGWECTEWMAAGRALPALQQLCVYCCRRFFFGRTFLVDCSLRPHQL